MHLMLELRRAARQGNAPVWRAVAERLARSRHGVVPLNVGQLERIAETGETVVVAGKLLAEGPLSKRLTVGAFAYSAEARAKIHAAGGNALSLSELLKAHPDGTGVRLLA
jgi:large subunit ribosomal protein L18e